MCRLMLLLGLALGLAPACVTPSPSPPATPGTSTPAQTAVAGTDEIAAARAAIEAVHLDDPTTIDALAGVRFTAAGRQAARELLASGASSDVRWAATWVYASSGGDPEPLRALLTDEDAAIRVMAAAALVALGERDGFAVLGASLNDSAFLRGSDPPLSVADFALATLVRYVEPAAAPRPPTDDEPVDATASRWADWLRAHTAVLTFDPALVVWKLP